MSHPGSLVQLEEPTAVGEARRRAASLCGKLGFSEAQTGKALLAITEAANNVLHHAQHGSLVLAPLEFRGVGGLQIIALDKGPGMADVSRCMEDGYSTRGTPGKGLGALARLSDVLDIYSRPGLGTALLSQVWASPPQSGAHDLGVVSLPLATEEVCGDGWTARLEGSKGRFVVLDGLGHGPGASQAARAAERLIETRPELSPVALLEQVHGALRGTRGAVMAVADVDFELGALRYAGIGNIAGAVVSGGARTYSMVSLNGSLGHETRRIAEYSYVWPPDPSAALVMHSDGLSNQWRLESYPGLLARHPALVAGVLFRDFGRARDDATVLVVRQPRPGSPARWGTA